MQFCPMTKLCPSFTEYANELICIRVAELTWSQLGPQRRRGGRMVGGCRTQRGGRKGKREMEESDEMRAMKEEKENETTATDKQLGREEPRHFPVPTPLTSHSHKAPTRVISPPAHPSAPPCHGSYIPPRHSPPPPTHPGATAHVIHSHVVSTFLADMRGRWVATGPILHID